MTKGHGKGERRAPRLTRVAQARHAAAVLACSFALTAAQAAELAPLPHRAPHETLGTVNCATATCHGSVTPWTGSNILHNEYTTWLREDKHTRTYAVLENAASRAIMARLGLETSATRTPACLDCHAHNPPPEQRGERFVQSEGLGCEGCHGPAEKWIASHTLDSATTADNIAHGMYPTSDPLRQARLCLSCHVGDSTRFVDHRLIGAGHPRLAFELSTFTSLQPPHYRVDDDYVERKGGYSPVRLWAIGQALAAQRLLATLADPKHGQAGLFPELALFDCHACHHPMSDQRWTASSGPGPGRVRLDDANLMMLRAIVRVIDPAAAASFANDIRALHRAVSGGDSASRAATLARVNGVHGTVTALLPRLRAPTFTPVMARRILAAVIDEAAATNYADYARAEQVYMAIITLANDLVAGGMLGASATLVGVLNNLLAALADDERYSALQFSELLVKLRAEIDAQVRS